MEQWEKASCCLNKKMQMIAKMAVNTEAQSRFIRRREMKGLKRTLEERDVLLRKLTAINAELSSDQTWKNIRNLAPLIQEIQHQEQNIIERSRQIIEEAIRERARIAGEIKSSRAQRQLREQYTNPWGMVVARGRCFNESG